MISHVYDFGLEFYGSDVLGEGVKVVQTGLEGIFEPAKLFYEAESGGLNLFVVAAARADGVAKTAHIFLVGLVFIRHDHYWDVIKNI